MNFRDVFCISIYPTQSIPNYKTFDFLKPSLTIRLIQKFVHNFHFFVVA